MAAADHAERVRRVEIARGRQLGDGLLAGIDEVGVLLALERERAGAEHAVLRLQLHIDAVRDVVRHQGRNTDAEIDVKTVLQFLGGAFGHLVAGPGHDRSFRSSPSPACGGGVGGGLRPQRLRTPSTLTPSDFASHSRCFASALFTQRTAAEGRLCPPPQAGEENYARLRTVRCSMYFTAFGTWIRR